LINILTGGRFFSFDHECHFHHGIVISNGLTPIKKTLGRK